MYGMGSATQTKAEHYCNDNWFPQHLIGQMLGAKSTTADQILMEVKPRNGIHF
jgi:hypothetical protein